MGFFANFRAKNKLSQTLTGTQSPPPYTSLKSSPSTLEDSKPMIPEERKPKASESPAVLQSSTPIVENSKAIKASDTPQWLWSEQQCREWLIAVCRQYFNYTPKETQKVADKFFGMGSMLYAISYAEWQIVFPIKRHGGSVYNLLFGARGKKGAVPRNVAFSHWKNAEASSSGGKKI